MSFFIRKGDPSRRKSKSQRVSLEVNQKKKSSGAKSKRPRLSNLPAAHVADEEIESDSEIDSSDDVAGTGVEGVDASTEDVAETAQEKKLRLTKHYLSQLATEEETKAAKSDEDPVANRLREDVLEQAGKLQRNVADNYSHVADGVHIQMFRGHRLTVTCVVISSDNQFVFSGSKDGNIIKWSTSSGKKLRVIPSHRPSPQAPAAAAEGGAGHKGDVFCLALTTDNKFLASGGKDKQIYIWRPESCEHVHTFKGHRDAVSGLVFRRNSKQLYSASHDRSVKIWSLDEMIYVETLFGHQDVITSIDSLVRERCVTSGARDGSIRIWKIIEESQLVYLGHSGCIDCVRFVNEEHFVSGGDDGAIALWSTMKKKPVYTHYRAHHITAPQTSQSPQISPSLPQPSGDVMRENKEECWISSLAALPYTDLIASGSRDGYIRLWKCGDDYKSLHEVAAIAVQGFVNHIRFSADGQYLAAAVGQEHKLGRWWKVKKVRNNVVWIKLTKSEDKPLANGHE